MGATLHASLWVRSSRRTILGIANPLEVPLHTQEAILELMERDNRDNAGQSYHSEYIHYAYQNRIHTLQSQSPDHGRDWNESHQRQLHDVHSITIFTEPSQARTPELLTEAIGFLSRNDDRKQYDHEGRDYRVRQGHPAFSRNNEHQR